MTDLTEYTWYYCKMKDGDIRMLERGIDYFLSGDVPLLNNEVKEVLAPVPSYEEWKSTGKFAMEAIKVAEENTKLKELLKECREPLEVLAEKRDACDWCPEDLLTKINQALGKE